ncbi:MAG: aminopeptidase P family protein [Methanobrevibacter sp.]|jgi:Xaa-Pro dipeptidase|nr:aminopeptidase P family protein [Candidatus Methanoflexus mossambicus]
MLNNQRLNSIATKLHEKELNGMITANIKNIQYITNYKPTSIAFLILKEEPIIFTTKMDMEIATKQIKTNDLDIDIREYETIAKMVDEIKKEEIKNLAFEEDLTYKIYEKLENSFKLSKSNLINEERMVKTKNEIKAIKMASKIAHKSFLELDIISKQAQEMREWEASYELGYLIRKNGGEEESFETICISGSKTSQPHGKTGKEKLSKPILVDWGCRYNDYCSDTTRTIVYSEKEAEIQAIVLEAYQKAIKSIKVGMEIKKVDKVARDIIYEYGYRDNFIHTTGHGIGLDVHEKPNVSKREKIKLEKDMVITIEPGIYLENEFGVRIEDTIHVKNNAKVLGNLKPILN